MAVFRTGNPALSEKTFRGLARTGDGVMTLQGTVNKSGLSLLIVCAGAVITWNMAQPVLLVWLGLIGGAILGVRHHLQEDVGAHHDADLRLPGGPVPGRRSRGCTTSRCEGIVPIAVGLTLGTLGALLLAYTSRLIKVTENFRLGLFAATGAIALLYLVSFALGFFGIRIPLIHEAGIVGHRVQRGGGRDRRPQPRPRLRLHRARLGHGRAQVHGVVRAPSACWSRSIWLYLEILRLLSKIMGSKDRR